MNHDADTAAETGSDQLYYEHSEGTQTEGLLVRWPISPQLTAGGGASEEGVAPLLQTTATRLGLAGVGADGVLEPISEHLHIFLQQQELTENHVGLERHGTEYCTRVRSEYTSTSGTLQKYANT